MDGYRNPVLPGFHPDPSVCRVGDEYVLATSSFTYAPGVPIFRSSDLVHWTQAGNALDRPDQLDLSGTERYSSLGVFAPTLRHHDGRLWLITTVFRATGPDNLIVTAERPEGPWSAPVRVDLAGIDPDLAWDADGGCWVHFSNGVRIERCRVDPETGTRGAGPEPTWSGTGLQFPEAPHLLERDGTWYLLIAEGGTERGHSVSIARGPSPSGPWEGCPANPILSHRSSAHPIQSTGHADLVEAADGSWWMVLLGTRPRGGSPLFHVLGRETFLAPVEWVGGWPVVGPVELEVVGDPPGRGAGAATGEGPEGEPVDELDTFTAPELHPRWLGVRQHPSRVSHLDPSRGALVIGRTDADLDSPLPAFVGRRQQHERARATVEVDPGDASEAGLAVRMDERHHYEVAVAGERVIVRARIGPVATVVADVARPTGASGPTGLVVETAAGRGTAPDIVVLGHLDDAGRTHALAELDGRYLSTEVAGGMLGRVIGMYSVGGEAAFTRFRYEELRG